MFESYLLGGGRSRWHRVVPYGRSSSAMFIL